MAGAIVPICNKRKFDSSGLAGGTTETVVAKAIDVSTYREASILARLHSLPAPNINGSFKVIVRAESPSIDDPATDFVYGTDVATITIAAASVGPTLYIAAVRLSGTDVNFGTHLRVVVQANGAAGGDLAYLSIDLSVKV